MKISGSIFAIWTSDQTYDFEVFSLLSFFFVEPMFLLTNLLQRVGIVSNWQLWLVSLFYKLCQFLILKTFRLDLLFLHGQRNKFRSDSVKLMPDPFFMSLDLVKTYKL